MRTELFNATAEMRHDFRIEKYSIPDQTDLTNKVEEICTSESMKKTLVSPITIAKSGEDINPNGILRSLPKGMSDDDFVGILKLAMYTEAGTDHYGDVIANSGKRYGQLYVVRFIDDFWRPDEYDHKKGYRRPLNKLGVSDEEIDREIAEMNERGFPYGVNHTPIEATTFGIPQENLTGNYHHLIAEIFRPTAPDSAIMSDEVTRREYLHEALYKVLTAGQLAQNPLLVSQVAWSLAMFELPGNTNVPELQKHARRWLELMGSDTEQIKKNLVRSLYDVVSDVDTAGMLATEYMVIKDVPTPVVSPKVIRGVLDFMLDKLRTNAGHQFMGEVLLESVGIDFPLKDNQGMFAFVKNKVRTMFANQIKAVPLVA